MVFYNKVIEWFLFTYNLGVGGVITAKIRYSLIRFTFNTVLLFP